MEEALRQIELLKERARHIKVVGGREYNPGWHMAIDLQKQLIVSECIARSALTREESRGGHTRDDFPGMNPEWRKVNLVCRLHGENVDVTRQALPDIPAELASLFKGEELSKYMTSEELTALGREVSYA
jgi:succinate dehydrogenase / fumarate reductase flavoprotein subunit